MIAAGYCMIGCLLLAQTDDTARPGLKPRLVPKRTAPATRFEPDPTGAAGMPTNDDRTSGAGGGFGGGGFGGGTRQPPERSLQELEPALRERAGLERAGRGKLRPPELLAEAIASPKNGRLKGRPIALVDVLARQPDRTAQRTTAADYWRLAIAQAQYHFALEQRDSLNRSAEGHNKVGALAESQLASADAAVDEAEYQVLRAGATLGALANLEDGQLVPWAVDRPHVGDYRTEYDRLFAGRAAPPRLRLIHRTLPINRRAIDVHGEAVVAAAYALETTQEEYRQGTAEYTTVVACVDRLATERRAFLQSVLRYNEDIAEYAFAVAPAQADASMLANMLIKRPSPPKLAGEGGEYRGPQTRGSAGAATGEMNPAESFEPAGEAPMGVPFNGAPADEGSFTPRTFRQEETIINEPDTGDSGLLPRSSGRGALNVARRANVDNPFRLAVVGRAVPNHGGTYQGLLSSPPAMRAEKLAELLHWADRELPAESGEKTTLSAALDQVPGPARRGVIDAYWQTAERIANYLVAAERSEALAALAPQTLDLRSHPGGASAMLRLTAAKQSAQAAVLDAQLEMLSAEFNLTRLANRPADSDWLRPSTVPHAGIYNVTKRSAPAGRVDVHAGTRVTTLHLELEDQARAVVFADEYRAEFVNPAERRAANIDLALGAIDRQQRETSRFLRALNHYNLAIADYALATLPAGATARQVVDMLVIEKH